AAGCGPLSRCSAPRPPTPRWSPATVLGGSLQLLLLSPVRGRGVREQMFRSLRVRNYRLYFRGQLVSSVGTWVQTVAQGWLVLRLSHNNGSSLGIVVSLQYIPMLVMGAWAGVLADRMSKRNLLIAT